jgi:hypothetical protein
MKKTETKKITERTWRMMHAAFTAPRRNGSVDIEDPPTLRELARTFGVPFAQADERAFHGRWELERAANEARAWLARYGGGAATEAEFLERYGEGTFGHVARKGPEAARWVKAKARRIWVDLSADLERWEAFLEERAADEAFQGVKAGCAHCRQEARAAA